MTQILPELVALVGHIVWPVTAVLILFGLRKPIHQIISTLINRIADKHTSVLLSKSGLEIRAARNEAKLAILEARQEQTTEILLKGTLDNNQEPARCPIDPPLRELAQNYLNVTIPNYRDRLRLKNAIASEMALYTIRNRIDRDALAGESNEAFSIALASASLLDRRKDDLARLLRAGKAVERLHVRYRIVVAILSILENERVSGQEIEDINQLASRYKNRADAPLIKQIDRLSHTLGNLEKQLESNEIY